MWSLSDEMVFSIWISVKIFLLKKKGIEQKGDIENIQMQLDIKVKMLLVLSASSRTGRFRSPRK